MSMISLRLPDSIHAAARDLAEKEDVSLNQLIATAVAEKLSALSAEKIIGERALRGDRPTFPTRMKSTRTSRPWKAFWPDKTRPCNGSFAS